MRLNKGFGSFNISSKVFPGSEKLKAIFLCQGLRWFLHASSKVHFRSTESETFYWSIMTAVDSIKCRCANSGMTGQVGDFQNPGVFLQAFPSFLPHSLPALSVAPFFARSLTLVPRSLLRNQTEALAKHTAVCRTKSQNSSTSV